MTGKGKKAEEAAAVTTRDLYRQARDYAAAREHPDIQDGLHRLTAWMRSESGDSHENEGSPETLDEDISVTDTAGQLKATITVDVNREATGPSRRANDEEISQVPPEALPPSGRSYSRIDDPYLRVEITGETIALCDEVTTIGRGSGVDVRLDDPSVSRLHAEIVRRGPYVYVADLGLSRYGTRVNGRPVARWVLDDGDVLSFGTARCLIGGLPREEELTARTELRGTAVPELTRRELDVLVSLCRPALSDDAFATPATAREIARDLVVSEAAVKQHLLRLYQKFRIPEGPNRRTRLANEVIAFGLVRPFADYGSRQALHPDYERT